MKRGIKQQGKEESDSEWTATERPEKEGDAET
jgi:hypothetical protein